MKSRLLFHMPSAQHGLTIISLLAGLFQFSCSPKLLNEDFSKDSLNQLPKKDIPGDPAGDSIQYIPQVEQRLRIVAYEPGASDKALAFNSKPNTLSTQGSYSTTWLNFKGIKTGNFSKTISYLVFGKFDNFRDPILIDLTNGSALVFMRLEMEQDGTLYALRDFSAPRDRTPICRLKPNETYTMSFQINMKDGAKGTCRIGLIGNVSVDGEDQSSTNKTVPLMNNPINDVQGPIRPSISFNWPDEHAAGQSQFTITGITIQQ